MREFEIALTDLRFYARHGVFEQENRIGNEFLVTVRVRIPAEDNIKEDSLDSTVSYVDMFQIVREEMEKPRKLLETVAASIEKKFRMRWPSIRSGSITICKSTPPIAHISGSSEVTLFF